MYMMNGPRGPLMLMTSDEKKEFDQKVQAVREEGFRHYLRSKTYTDLIICDPSRPQQTEGAGSSPGPWEEGE